MGEILSDEHAGLIISIIFSAIVSIKNTPYINTKHHTNKDSFIIVTYDSLLLV